MSTFEIWATKVGVSLIYVYLFLPSTQELCQQ